MNRLQLRTTLIFGENALDYLKEIQAQRVFIVCDPFMVESGLLEQVLTPLAGNIVSVFSDIVPDPPIDLIVKGMQALQAFDAQVVVAFGGGSAIDAAKAIKHFAIQTEGKGFLFIAIPTTSGTGSEVTSFAVITDPEKGIKYPLVSQALLPDVAILAKELVRSVPPVIVADTGMDVLTHAIEAYVSAKATDFSDALAEKAVCMVFANLLQAYQQPDDLSAKEKMHHASTLAGLAFNEASLGLNHAIAHVIGGKLKVPHGRTNAILLPHIIAYNADLQGFSQSEYSRAAEKYACLAKLAGFGGNNCRLGVRNLINEINKLQKAMAMPTRLSQCKLAMEPTTAVREEIMALALEDACYLTNPKTAAAADIGDILQKII